MSRRAAAAAAAGADRTEQNRATLKQLVKLESNKSCADCKRNKHPRWASWTIGVFVCIRCSGIHRGLGTHISRVKSVDLDSWTDEQMQSMLRWGNARANKYWEHKLAEGHVPNEGKIENFIRTKYDSKRWVMDGPMPDPSTLDDGTADDDAPLNVVREKAIGDRQRSGSLRSGSGSGGALPLPPRARPQEVDLFADAEESAPVVRPSTTEPALPRPGPPKAPAAPPKQTKPGESLLGLDFFGGISSAPPARPSSTGPTTPGVPGRADLKSSILSLYASKPAAPPQPPAQPQSNMNAFGGMQSPPLTSPTQPQSNAQSFGGLNDAFSSLSFTSPQQSQPKPAPFSNLTSPTGHSRQTSTSKPALSGGSFFDMKPAAPPKPTSPPSPPNPAPRKESFGGDFGDFSSAAPPLTSAKSPPAANNSSMDALFDISSPAAPAPPPKPAPAPAPAQARQPSIPTYTSNTAFNLSQPLAPPQPKPSAPQQQPPQTSTTLSPNFSSLNTNFDAWGSNDAWASPDQPAVAPPPTGMQMQMQQTNPLNTFIGSKPAAAAPLQPSMMTMQQQQQTPFDSGWGSDVMASPTTTNSNSMKPPPPPPGSSMNMSMGMGMSAGGFGVQPDEEFGGWSHASPVATSAGPKQGGGGGGGGTDDLFGNVWE